METQVEMRNAIGLLDGRIASGSGYLNILLLERQILYDRLAG